MILSTDRANINSSKSFPPSKVLTVLISFLKDVLLRGRITLDKITQLDINKLFSPDSTDSITVLQSLIRLYRLPHFSHAPFDGQNVLSNTLDLELSSLLETIFDR
eukprot:CAMPEP_0184359154 /NCGR_PEP_ID=MMETSP1089-20130417/118681_1 /TAXON_ID=38269 ORGANISM="Gloeochaete wittrockiana, Strain SAG46.84" /NCGR_SAMPLE_ID=MMETSP1089 /ASSEMBLY_ACC=CAM_ASM_000445 /LENGTH=104 /DNA_ID=CAMNT_0026697831 /DNA_START=1 /DNA_END=311 /DNA_ORIENTATION=-